MLGARAPGGCEVSEVVGADSKSRESAGEQGLWWFKCDPGLLSMGSRLSVPKNL